MNDRSLFGSLKKSSALFLFVYGVICALSYSFLPRQATQGLILIVYAVTSILSPSLCLASSFVCSLYSSVVFPAYIQVVLSVLVILSMFLRQISCVRHFKSFDILLISVVLISLSYVFGFKSDGNTALLMLLCVIRAVIMLNCLDAEDTAEPMMGYICCSVSMAIYFVLCGVKGISITTYNRLSFNGDIKTVAIAVAFPAMFVIIAWLERTPVFSYRGKSVIISDLFIAVSCLVILLLTLARGAIIGLIAGLLVYMLLTRKKANTIIRLIPLFCFAGLLVLTMLGSKMFAVQRLFNVSEYATGNGRTQIWKYYIDRINEMGLRYYIFGVGPGEISRIGSIDRYSHSTFLDIFFSYGIPGILFAVYAEIKLFLKTFSQDFPLGASVFVALCIIYSAHGAAANTYMFTFQVLLFMAAKRNEKERTL